jgi:threonine dehydratase
VEKNDLKISLEAIFSAKQKISSKVKLTSTEFSQASSDRLGSDVYLKFENTQVTGSFKIRGALNKVSSLSDSEKAKGVIAASAGNHAQGVALSAQAAKVKAVIVMPVTAPLIKVQSTRAFGAEVILHGDSYDEAYEHARELEKEKGYIFVHPFQDPLIIAGQGTIGLEIMDQLPEVDTVIVPIGGGGLISGIAFAIKSKNPKVKVIGVQSSQTPGMSQLYHQEPVTECAKRTTTIADGIAVKKPSKQMFETYIQKYVDQIVTVTDDEISEAITFLVEKEKTIAEGSGAAGLAALFNRDLGVGQKTLVLLCGGNIDLNLVSQILDRGLIRKGRLTHLSVITQDLPGALASLTKILGDNRANILEVHHDRVSRELFLKETKIDFVLETSGPDHILQIKSALKDSVLRFA